MPSPLRLAARLTVSALVLLPATVHAKDLLRAYEMALAQDMQFQAARHARDAALEARPQARAALLPQLAATYGYQDERQQGTEGFGPNPPLRVDRNGDLEALTVTLDQALFDWAAVSRYAQAGHEVALAHAQLRSAEQDLLLRTAQAYFGVLGADDDLRLAGAEKRALERQLDLAQRRFEVGLAAITDVQEAQARHDLTLAQEIAFTRQSASAREALREITGTAPEAVGTLQDELPLQLPAPPALDPWLDRARQNNLEVVTADLRARIARESVSVARAGHYPTVGAQAQYQDASAEGGRFTGDLETRTLGVQVRVPIFAGLATRSRVDQAQALREQVEAQRNGIRRAAERRTHDAFLGVQSGAARVRALRQAVLSSTTALEASQTGLDVGTRTAVDVLNAQSALYSAQRDHARARYEYLLSVLQLKAAAGALEARDLAEIDALLVEH